MDRKYNVTTQSSQPDRGFRLHKLAVSLPIVLAMGACGVGDALETAIRQAGDAVQAQSDAQIARDEAAAAAQAEQDGSAETDTGTDTNTTFAAGTDPGTNGADTATTETQTDGMTNQDPDPTADEDIGEQVAESMPTDNSNPPTASGVGDSSEPLMDEAQAMRASMLALVNEVRAAGAVCGSRTMAATGPLTISEQLTQAATSHADYMQRANAFDHIGEGGSTPAQRVTATGYQWRSVGENIAAGYPSVVSVVQGWLKSPGHCRNLMSPNFTEIGMALAEGADNNEYANYWAMVLATPY